MSRALSITFLFASLYFQALSQSGGYIKNPAIGIHIMWDDFKSADFIRNHSLYEALQHNEFANAKNLKSGLGVSYLQGISRHFDVSFGINAAYLDYALHNGTGLGKGALLLETEATVSGKIGTDRNFLTPYLITGVGVSKYKTYYGIFVPTGLGLQINFHNKAYILLNSEYRTALSSNVNNHFYYSIGLAGNIRNKSRNKVVKPVVLNGTPSPDRDRDGIPDSLDACPEVAGLKAFEGCPDTDGDGIPDNKDRCPRVAGVSGYEGCPVPDTDGDGINDENDSCPSIAGVLRYHGCPVPDTDGDGINDELDACPVLRGTVANHGCPEVNAVIKEKLDSVAEKILFETGSYSLLQSSKVALNYFARILKLNPHLEVTIEGNTDNVGSEKMNRDLSEKRAIAVLNYLVEKGGVDAKRLSAKGWGYSKPVADNGTPEGRALNRRVEFRIKTGIF